ncbi:MAG: type II toxin-antitoxin system Phd/YefM family antitoxin [Planctomycetes bacterium]|nr:type II toxin-antitoxin system Phd/YefM family antitoxin [Planctomycetota bacterium]
MERFQADVVKKNLADVLLLVGNGKQRVVIQRGSADRAALIPLEDLALLENLDGEAAVAVEHVPAVDVKRHLARDVDLVAGRGQRIVLVEDGKDVAALVPASDLALLENLDSRLDIEAAKRLLQQEIDKGD